MVKESILLIDDDSDILSILTLYFTKEKYTVISASKGQLALQKAKEYHPSIIILDVMLPDMDGYEVCRLLRQHTSVPILFLSAKEDDFDKILAHRIGGDDYITKPFSPAVLVAKVQAHLRRQRPNSHSFYDTKHSESDRLLTYPSITIDRMKGLVIVHNRQVTLSTKEFQLLCLLAENPNIVFSVEQLYEYIWREEGFGDYRTVMVHISNLRKKIDLDPSKPQLIITKRGKGYMFNEHQSG
ncbi:response regulator transcription factor [Metabacillus malikii]|uniref:DNA-binding response OmpR family regulator n=1 Tax=Metabacillus malikii TaxID=1504265 RepID=A0ABT9Z9L8_9BACI|nr:response regulator transcription factor [Metabacillus malikii]MDQ0228955.1 DNA-binding response OmpR family regulator [Metabacillus malikii]